MSRTCLCNEIKRGDSWLVASRAKVQADGERLAPPYNQTIYAVEISAMVRVVELALQVPAVNVQTLREEGAF